MYQKIQLIFLLVGCVQERLGEGKEGNHFQAGRSIMGMMAGQ
jgi:hypothetical protein